MPHFQNRRNELIISSIQNLLYGTSNNGNSVYEVFQRNDLTLLSNKFAVILIHLERKQNKEYSYSQDLISFIITNVIEELAGTKHQGFVVPIDTNRYGCLVNFSPSDTAEQDLLSIAKEGKDFLEKKFGIYFTMSLSTIHTELNGIHQAYQEALYAMEYRLTMGSNEIIPYKQQLQDGSNPIYTFSFKTDHSINLFLKEAKDHSQIVAFVTQLFENSKIGCHTPPSIARDFIYDIAGSLSKAINDMFPEDIQWKKEIFNRLTSCDTLKIFKTELINVLKEYQEYLNEKLSQDSISAQVQKYIDQNYHDSNLSVNTLGDEFNLSPAYLSKIFKEESGISILDYISKCRINHAKKLLKNTDKTIKQIAKETGFLSSSVFIRVFKKIEGITPGAYRKL